MTKTASATATAPEVELTSEESTSALATALAAKRQTVADSKAASDAAAEDEAKSDPDRFIVLEGSDTVEAPKGWQRDRTITVGGLAYEHVSDDVRGRWVYRHM